MTDQDFLLPGRTEEFGSGVIGVCDVCGERQAVVILQKERFRLCVLDFLNKSWLKTANAPGAPLPAYRSERLWFETTRAPSGKAPAVVLSPTKVVRRPALLVVPEVYGLTTTLLDAGIRFAREGFEVLLPDIAKTDGFGPRQHLALRGSRVARGGVALRSPPVARFVELYADALAALRAREMVDPAKVGLFGASYGGSLALALAALDPRTAAVAVAYPMPTDPPDLGRAITAPLAVVRGSRDPFAARAVEQLTGSAPPGRPIEVGTIPSGRHLFLAREDRAYDVAQAEAGWSFLLEFMRRQLMPPPPRPLAPPVKTAEAGAPAKPTPA